MKLRHACAKAGRACTDTFANTTMEQKIIENKK